MDEQLNEFLDNLPVNNTVTVEALRIGPDGQVQEDYIDTHEFEDVQSVLIDRFYIIIFLGEAGIKLYRHDTIYNISMSAGVTVQSWELKGDTNSKGELE